MSRVQVLDGFTAYGIAVKHGFCGTEEEWLESLRANGNVNPVVADETMTIPVGVDAGGKLYAGKDPDVNQLKDELQNKLPKSPSNWEQWTAEEQAAAREMIGIPGDYELIEKITLEEDTNNVTIALPYNCISVYSEVTTKNIVSYVDYEMFEGEKKICGMWMNHNTAGTSSVLLENIGGIGFPIGVFSRVNKQSVANGSIASAEQFCYIDMLKFLCFGGTDPKLNAGSTITIYGVRA